MTTPLPSAGTTAWIGKAVRDGSRTIMELNRGGCPVVTLLTTLPVMVLTALLPTGALLTTLVTTGTLLVVPEATGPGVDPGTLLATVTGRMTVFFWLHKNKEE